jgi:hypothetical protein
MSAEDYLKLLRQVVTHPAINALGTNWQDKAQRICDWNDSKSAEVLVNQQFEVIRNNTTGDNLTYAMLDWCDKVRRLKGLPKP